MAQDSQTINAKIASIRQKLKRVTNPVPLSDDFVLQCFVQEMTDNVTKRKQVLQSCLARTKSSIEFNDKVAETMKKA